MLNPLIGHKEMQDCRTYIEIQLIAVNKKLYVDFKTQDKAFSNMNRRIMDIFLLARAAVKAMNLNPFNQLK